MDIGLALTSPNNINTLCFAPIGISLSYRSAQVLAIDTMAVATAGNLKVMQCDLVTWVHVGDTQSIETKRT